MNLSTIKNKSIVLLFLIALVFIHQKSVTYTGGAPGGYSNAPNESNCTSCHNGTLQTSGTNFNNISLSNNFTGGGYIPDSTYTITLNYSHTGKSKFGYQLTCLDNSNRMAGSFSLISGNNKSSMSSATISGNTRNYMGQTRTGASGSGSASWSFRWKAPSSNKDTLTIYAVVNSTNSSSSTAGDVIIAKQFKLAPSSLLPKALANTNNSNPCQNTSFQLSGSGTNSPTSYSWSIPGGNPSISNQQNPSVVFNFPGKYKGILTVTNAKGKSKPDTVQINVLRSPGPFISGASSRSICNGDSILLKPISIEPGVKYTWNNGLKSDSIWASEPGDYFVSAQSANGCGKNSNTISVRFYDKPISSLSSSIKTSNDSTCENSVITLFSDSTNYDSFYFFNSGRLLISSSNSSYDVIMDTSSTFELQVRDQRGCLSDTFQYDVFTKEKLPKAQISCSTSTPDSITFNWSDPYVHNGYQVSIDGGKNWSFPSSGNNGKTHEIGNLNPEDSITIWVRGVDPSPCFFSDIASKKCYTKACSPLNFTVDASSKICLGDLWTIEINGLKNENYSINMDGGSPFKDTLFSFNPTISRDYVIKVKDSSFLTCPAKEIKIPLVIDEIINSDLRPAKEKAFCVDENITFIASDSMDKWNFILNGAMVQSGNSSSYTNNLMSDGDSIFVVITKGECIDTTRVLRVNIESNIDASFDYSRTQSEYLFSPTISSFDTYSWNFGDGSPSSSDISPTHNYKTSEGKDVNVNLTVTTSNQCVEDSSQQISLPLFSNVHEFNHPDIHIYPNPVDHTLHLDHELGRALELKIRTISGKLIQENSINTSKNQIDLCDLEKGIYIIEIVDREQHWSTTIIKK
ncbi:PKD domain-containing protein [Bacteroidia bacterium]|nr:PKD domain-containing protein [Bacteroidia bacterium]